VLRYESIDDLMASIEDFTPDDRMTFLNDAKQDNRILVLKALSQLKLDTNRKGKPMTFTELIDREAPDFVARDWVDLTGEGAEHLQRPAVREALLTFLSDSGRLERLFPLIPDVETARLFHTALQEALPGTKPALVAHVRLSPYFAGVFDKEAGVGAEPFTKYAELDTETRRRLVSADLSARIGALVQEGVLPEQYAVAVAKTVFLVEVGDVSAQALSELFGKRLGLNPEQGSALARRIRSELLTEEPVPEGKIAPLESAPEESAPAPIEKPTPHTPQRQSGQQSNVVDLRQRP
jgi:hypothetical protein